MQIEIRIITQDIEFGLDLVESKRFPERRPIIVPGEAVISSQNMVAGDESVGFSDIIDLVIDINEDTSVEMFADWFHGKLKTRTQKIHSLIIAGTEIQIDEAEIKKALLGAS